ncbi:MAG TPA: carboxypeptidase-like regulatory domain-containing protein, partial [Blastocatellia bacterium]|nr:carboxypeptidase-like regulatory domain-containing protein [Blastocatellia bacterium]
MKRIAAIFVILLLTCYLIPPTLAQQVATATLNGRIMDPQGAAIAGAEIKAKQKATGLQRTAGTNSEGFFTITNLPPGTYELQIKASEFKTQTYSEVVLEVGQSRSLDTTLAVGGSTLGDLDLTAEVELMNRSTSVVDGVVGRRAIENLPLNGRNFLELALLIPGNSPAPNFDPTKTNTVLISSAGQLGRGGNVTVDGADNNDDVVGGSLINVSQEAVQEFQSATNRFSAELGRSGSSVINIVTKTGTNELHGSTSFFFRNRNLQGLPATFDRSNPDPPFDREQVAFGVGEPIIKDK